MTPSRFTADNILTVECTRLCEVSGDRLRVKVHVRAIYADRGEAWFEVFYLGGAELAAVMRRADAARLLGARDLQSAHRAVLEDWIVDRLNKAPAWGDE